MLVRRQQRPEMEFLLELGPARVRGSRLPALVERPARTATTPRPAPTARDWFFADPRPGRPPRALPLRAPEGGPARRPTRPGLFLRGALPERGALHAARKNRDRHLPNRVPPPARPVRPGQRTAVLAQILYRGPRLQKLRPGKERYQRRRPGLTWRG